MSFLPHPESVRQMIQKLLICYIAAMDRRFWKMIQKIVRQALLNSSVILKSDTTVSLKVLGCHLI